MKEEILELFKKEIEQLNIGEEIINIDKNIDDIEDRKELVEIIKKFKLLYEKNLKSLMKLTNISDAQQKSLQNTLDTLQINEKKLEEIIREKDRILSIIAHDLRSPFTVIIGLCELVNNKSHEFDAEQLYRMFALIHNSSKNTYKMIDNLLNYANNELGKIKIAPEKIDINAIINENISLFEINTKDKNITVKNEVKDIYAWADIMTVSSVIRNLYNNAIKFTMENGKINFRAKVLKEDEIEVTITDTGVGISADNIKKIMENNEVFTTKGTNGESGSGIGLGLINQFLSKNGGSLKIESEVGVGTTVRVKLPSKTIKN